MNILDIMSDTQKVIYAKYDGIYPFKIVEFINDLGLKIFTSSMSTELSGAICKENGEYVIYINESHPPKRLFFTLAHELGHFFCDKDYLDEAEQIIDGTKHSTKVLFRKNHFMTDEDMKSRDIRANQFAAELLMPEGKFIEEWRKKSTAEEVANFFGVSLEAAKIRASILLGEIF